MKESWDEETFPRKIKPEIQKSQKYQGRTYEMHISSDNINSICINLPQSTEDLSAMTGVLHRELC